MRKLDSLHRHHIPYIKMYTKRGKKETQIHAIIPNKENYIVCKWIIYNCIEIYIYIYIYICDGREKKRKKTRKTGNQNKRQAKGTANKKPTRKSCVHTIQSHYMHIYFKGLCQCS